jgi:NADH-quinone oxidoreductase subunit G
LLAANDMSRSAVFIGNAAAQHPDAAKIHALAEWIAKNSDAGFGYLTEAANTVGGYLAQAHASTDASAVFSQAKKAYLVLHAEPEFDCGNPQQATSALNQAEMVIVMSPFKHGMAYADVLLPVSPFTETAGTFVNCEGRAQSFHGVVKPLGETRPAWKVLRVLGNLLGLENFDYETAEAVRDEVLGKGVTDLSSRLNNMAANAPTLLAVISSGLERVSDVPIYSTDAIVRRAESLQKTADAKAPSAYLSTAEFAKLAIKNGDYVKLTQEKGSVILPAALDANLAANVVRVAAGLSATQTLGAMFGSIKVERAI